MTKKNYIQPSMEVSAVKALQNMLNESNPFTGGGGTDETTPIMAPKRKTGDTEPF